jgi:hypothetical protein
MEHNSYVVRGCAAKALGRLHHGCWTTGKSVPPTGEMLAWKQREEAKGSGVAGAFLDGAQWGLERWDKYAGNVDLRAWFLDTLRLGGKEANIPQVQTLEFYAHEFFDLDPDGIRELLRMGRPYLAVLAATESPESIDQMRNLLKEMLKWPDERVRKAIEAYLQNPCHHRGTEFFGPDDK